MANNRVREYCNTTGTGNLVPAGAYPRSRAFSAAGLSTGSKFRYVLELPSGPWEVGIGTYQSDGSVARSFEDSSTGALLNLTGEAGTTLAITMSAATLAALSTRTVLIPFCGGSTVVADTYPLADLPAGATVLSLKYEIGTAGGSFTAGITLGGTNVTGLSSLAVGSSNTSASPGLATASGANVAPAGGARVALVITGVTGAPAGSVLVLTYALGP